MENFLLSVVLFILLFSVIIKAFKQPLPQSDSRVSPPPKIPSKPKLASPPSFEPTLTEEETAISSNFPPPSLETPPLPQLTVIEETPATVFSVSPSKLPVNAEKSVIFPSYTSNVSSINLNSPYQLRDYLAHPDSAIRASVATQLGNQMAETSVRAETMPAIASLGRLSQDSDPLVRQSAVNALGKISSEKVIPFLKKALRDADSDVVKCASAALDKYKGYGVRSLKTSPKKTAKRLPKSTL